MSITKEIHERIEKIDSISVDLKEISRSLLRVGNEVLAVELRIYADAIKDYCGDLTNLQCDLSSELLTEAKKNASLIVSKSLPNKEG